MQLIKREGMTVMFKAVGADYWEVHQVRIRKAETMFGKEVPEREVLAGNEDFGKYAWACVSQGRADGRFADVLALGGAPVDVEGEKKDGDSV